MQFAGLHRKDFENAVGRGLYPEAPKTTAGQARIFAVDDLVAAYVLGQLYEREVLPKFACEIAVAVRRELRKSATIKTLSAWKLIGKNGKPRVVVAQAAPSQEAIELFRFQVAEIRARARAGIAAKLREQ